METTTDRLPTMGGELDKATFALECGIHGLKK